MATEEFVYLCHSVDDCKKDCEITSNFFIAICLTALEATHNLQNVNQSPGQSIY